MPPVFAVNDPVDCGSANSIFGSQLFSRNAALRKLIAYLQYLRFDKHSEWIFRAMTIIDACSSFSPHIGQIIPSCAKEEMIRPDARRIVAVMKNAHVIGNLPVVKFPCYAVRVNRMSTDGGSHSSIAVIVETASPQPTRLAFLHFVAKTLKDWYFSSRHRLLLLRNGVRSRMGDPHAYPAPSIDDFSSLSQTYPTDKPGTASITGSI